MTPGDIEVFLPAFRKDDFPNVWSLMDNSFQVKYPRFRDWREHISQQRRNCKFACDVLVTSEGLTHHFESVASPRNYNALLGYAILRGRRLLPAVPRSGEDPAGGHAQSGYQTTAPWHDRSRCSHGPCGRQDRMNADFAYREWSRWGSRSPRGE
jgi:hypothetical protein